MLISPAYAQAASASTGSDWMAFLPIIFISLFLSPICYALAKQKGRNATKWLLIGLIPEINYLALSYLIGATDLTMKASLDKILSILEKNRPIA